MNKNYIETSRLILRRFEETDIDDFFECCQNPNLGNNAGWKPHESKEESLGILKSFFIESENNVWAVVLKETDRIIGSIGLVPDPKRENPHSGMLGYWLKESCWGKGYMSEATQAVLKFGFSTLNLNLVTANCYPHNERSQQVLKRNGFVYEGLLHQAEVTYDEKVLDHLCYYLTKEVYIK